MKIKYKKGEIYSPDELPKDCNQYFSGGKKEYEFGTVRCIKSFEIEWKIKELQS